MGNSRVTPMKQISIPRLELSADLVSVKISATLRKGWTYDKIEKILDGQVVWVISTIKPEDFMFLSPTVFKK